MKRFGLATTCVSLSAMLACIVLCSSQPACSAPDESTEIFSAPVNFTNAAEQTINGVVSIKSYATPTMGNPYGGGSYIDPFEFFFGYGQRQQPRQPQQQPKEQQKGLGSGVIISDDGYIVTNNHVIDNAQRLEVTLNDNRSFDAKVIGTDPVTDLALIKIDNAKDLHVIKIGDSEALRIGEWVLAVGNPFGFTSTVTAGIVSAKGRSISAVAQSRQMGIESFIQTDAAVNPGNSGGALVNTKGELIGINTAIYSQTGSYAGHSFAIPTSIVTKIIADLKQYGTVQRAVLGVEVRELTPELAKEKEITAVTEGVYVANVIEGGAADEADIKAGDVLTAINGHAIHNFAQLQEQISKYSPGDEVTVGYVRDNKQASTKAKLRNSQGNTSITKVSKFEALGAEFDTPDKDTMKRLGLRAGVQIKKLQQGKLKSEGVKPGFIIVSVNGSPVKSASDIEAIYKAIVASDDSEKGMFLSGIYPDGRRFYYAIDLAE